MGYILTLRNRGFQPTVTPGPTIANDCCKLNPANAGTSWRVGHTPVHIVHTSVLRKFWRETPTKWNGVWGDDVDLYDTHKYSGE